VIALMVGVVVATPWLLETDTARDFASAQAKKGGLTLTWERLSLSVRNAQVEVRGLEVGTPGLRATVKQLSLGWAWERVVHLRRLELDDVAVHLVPSTDDASAPSTPPRWSELLAPLEALPPVHVDAITVRRLAVHHPNAVAEGLSIEGHFHAGQGITTDARLALAGGALTVRQAGTTQALELELTGTATLAARTTTIELRSAVGGATPPLAFPVSELIDTKLIVALEPEQHRAVTRLERARLLGDGATATATLHLKDETLLPVVEAAALGADLHTLLPLARVLEPSLALESGRVDVTAKPDGTTTPPLEARLSLARLTTPWGGLQQLIATASLNPSSEHATAHAGVDDAFVVQSGQRIQLRRAVLDANATRRGAKVSASSSISLDDVVQKEPLLSARALVLEMQSDDLSATTLFPLTAKVSLNGTDLRAEQTHLGTMTLGSQLSLTSKTRGALTVEVPFERLDVAAASVGSGTARLEVPSFELDLLAPSRSRLTARLSSTMKTLSARHDATRVRLETATVSANASIADEAARDFSLAITTSPVTVDATMLAGGTLTLEGQDLRADRGRAALRGRLLGLEADTTVERTQERLAISGTLRAATLAPYAALVGPLLPDGLTIDSRQTSLFVEGTVRHERGVMSDDLHARVERPRVSLDGHPLSAIALDVRLKHRGGQGVQRVTGTATLERPEVRDAVLDGPLRLDLDGTLDRPRGVGALTAHVSALGDEELSLKLEFQRARSGLVTHQLAVDAGHLGPLLPLVRAWRGDEPELDLTALGVHLESKGSTTGLLDEALLPDPQWEAHVDSGQHVALVLTNLTHRTEGEQVRVPRVEFVLDAGVHHGALHLDSSVEAASIDLDLGHQHATLTGLHQRLVADSDEFPTHGELRLHLTGTLDRLSQNVWTPWAPDAVKLDADARLDRLSALSVDHFRLHSDTGGTTLDLTKRLRTKDVLPGRVTDEAVFVTGGQRFLLDGSLRQDLSRLDGDPAVFRGRGVVTLPFLADSADQQLFRVRGRLELDGVSASLPGSDLAIEDASGAASLEEAITFDPQNGIALVPSTDQRVFARARYQDLQPFLASDAVITAKRVRFGDVELAPVVTSLEVQRNRFSLNKLKAQRGAALLSGQVFLDYQPGNRAVTFRGAVTGLTREGATVPLDANAALSFSLERLEVDGRVQVVRTSREHVLDLLDVLDPHKEVASLNRLRTALGWGYPRQLRLDFHDGLLAMDVELGGLGALFDLGTLRGIALGPFVTRYLAPHLASRETP
jgi:hypothetical protein